MPQEQNVILEAALSYLRAGLSILPCELPNKNPAFRFLPRDKSGKAGWEQWTRVRVTEDEVRAWFDDPKPPEAIGIIGGSVSGNLEILDIDDASLIRPWTDAVKQLDPELLRSLVVEKTLRGRCHIFYRCKMKVPGSQKLAVGTAEENHKALIETKAEGGYVCAAPSPGYKILKGSLEALPVLSKLDRYGLIQISRAFNRSAVVTDAPAPSGDRSPGGDGDRPGDEFNQSGDWRAVVQAHGWECVRRTGEKEGWRRPGKDRGGISATWNHVPNAFYVFTTSGHPLEDQKAYSPFALLTILDYNGDYSAAAKALRKENHGSGSWNEPPAPGNKTPPTIEDPPHPGQSLAVDDNESDEPEPPMPEPPSYLRIVPDDDDAPERPAIHAGQDDLARIIDMTWDALEAHNDPPKLFHFGTSVSLVVQDSGGLTMLEHQSAHAMREHMARAARWFIWKPAEKKGGTHEKKDAKAPLDVAQILVASDPRRLPPLNRTISAPLMAPSGRIVDEPGYDAETRTYYVPQGLEVPPVPEDPLDEEIETARDLILRDLLFDFPFIELKDEDAGDMDSDSRFLSSPDRANALGMLILPFARELILGPTPLHLIEKPTPGSGASLIFQVLGRLVSGADPAIITEASTEDEWRKRVTSTLLKGPPIVAFDNLRRRLDSSALAAALTADVWEDRRLGASENIRMPIRNMWLATGNNPAVSNEIARRCVSIRIDSRLEKPWERDAEEFKHPKLLVWAHENRPQLICAVLTLLRAWHMRGRPKGDDSLGSYEQWANVIGGVLKVAGVDGFLKNRATFYERADQESSDWRALIASWWTKFCTTPVSSKEIWQLIVDEDLPIYLGKGSEHGQRITVGKQLNLNIDKRFTIDGAPMLLRRIDQRRAKVWQYQLVRIDAKGDPAIPTPVKKEAEEELFPGQR